MTEETTKPKQIFFVSWKQHKLDLAKSHVNDIIDDMMNDAIFNTIIDYCRKKYGFPNALPLRDITANDPVIPNSPEMLDQPTVGASQFERSPQTCPVCQATIDARLFTSHLEACLKKPGVKPKEIAIQLATKDSKDPKDKA